MQLHDTVVLALCIVSYVRAHGALATLQAISVADNKLTDASLPFLAKALATMPNLTKVDISDNLVSQTHRAPCIKMSMDLVNRATGRPSLSGLSRAPGWQEGSGGVQ